ncbi:MAG TPA: transposase [Acetomicrobium sp.]|nr:transposase [Acetomicrobium sp.]
MKHFVTLQPTSWEISFFGKWHFCVTHSRLESMITVTHMLAKHIGYMLTYLKRRITNTVSEEINGKIQQIKSAARSFRNFDNYRATILFYCGILDMYP